MPFLGIPDIIWGAGIGLVAAFVAQVGGYFLARLQAKASVKVVELQLAHQEQEARLTRTVEARKMYLLPFREAVSKWMKAANDSYTAVERLRQAEQERRSRPSTESEKSYQEELAHFNSVLDENQSAYAVFEILRGQSNDAKLDDLVEAARTAQEEAGTKIIPLTRVLNNTGTISVATIESALGAYHEVLKVLRSKLIAINKRIEELLTGAVTS